MTRRRFSAKTKAEIIARQGGLCTHCGKPATRWEFDHVIPLAMGGADDASNLEATHGACHREKTRQDVKNIAKVKRLQRTQRGERSRSRKGRALQSKGFTQWRAMDGTIRTKGE